MLRSCLGLVLVSLLAGCGGKVATATAIDGTSRAATLPHVPKSALDGACVSNVDCDATAVCVFTGRGAPCGTCAPGLGGGETCSTNPYETSRRCQQEMVCVGSSGSPYTGTCEGITYLPEGAPCEPSSSSTSYGDGPAPPVLVECAASLECIARTCGVPHARTLGAACDQDYDCAGGLFCASSTPSSSPSVCMPKLPNSSICDHDQACLSGLCCSYGPCAGEPFRCIEPAGLGEPCFGGGWCKAGLSCNDTAGVCVTELPLGAACNPESGDLVCVGGAGCDASTNTCVAISGVSRAGSLGDPCDDNRQCVEGLACGAGTCTSAADYCAASSGPSGP